MASSRDAFIADVENLDVRASRLVADHRADNDVVLLHLLMSDLLRLCVSDFHDGSGDLSQRLLDLLDRALSDGDDELQNAVLFSFVEHAGFGAGETKDFLATWPARLSKARSE